MARSINKVTLLGNVGKDPEIRATQEGKEIASFSVATSENWTDKNTGQRKEKTEWHSVVAFVPQIVDFVKKSVRKGSKVYIEGSLQRRKWKDAGNVERYVFEVLLQSYQSTFILLDNRDHSNLHGGNEGFSEGSTARGAAALSFENGDGQQHSSGDISAMNGKQNARMSDSDISGFDSVNQESNEDDLPF